MRCAELKPELSRSIFPKQIPQQNWHHGAFSKTPDEVFKAKNQRRRSRDLVEQEKNQNDDFIDDEIDDEDLIAAGMFPHQDYELCSHVSADSTGFRFIEEFSSEMTPQSHSSQSGLPPSRQPAHTHHFMTQTKTPWNPVQLENGKWACNHKCKDKTAYVPKLERAELN